MTSKGVKSGVGVCISDLHTIADRRESTRDKRRMIGIIGKVCEMC